SSRLAAREASPVAQRAAARPRAYSQAMAAPVPTALPDDVIAFLRGGLAIVVATRDDELQPAIAREPPGQRSDRRHVQPAVRVPDGAAEGARRRRPRAGGGAAGACAAASRGVRRGGAAGRPAPGRRARLHGAGAGRRHRRGPRALRPDAGPERGSAAVTEPVALESIRSCLRGVIPSPFATCSPDGTPNVTYLSIVHYVDPERVALSRQFFNKTRSNLDANPRSQVRVVEPETLREYVLDLRYLHTETHGPTFDAMRANTEAIASLTGMEGVFRLRGVDVHRVVRCAAVAGTGASRARALERGSLRQLDELTRRLALCTDYDE